MSLLRLIVMLTTLTASIFLTDSLARASTDVVAIDTDITSVVASKDKATRPKVALVLSGGGARGFAHIGVLRALRKLRVPVDMVVGTSIGAVVGGAYAAGRSADELEQIVHDTNWDSVLADRPARYDLDYRRKEEDLLLPSRIEFAVTKSGIFLPPAAAGNGALENALTRLMPEGMRDQPVDQLTLPFRSVASDLLTGEMVELNDTPLLMSMRASLALPGVFAPVRIKQKLVVDGGLVSNLPVELARKMGADIVIAVNVGTPLAKESELNSAIDVTKQMLQILTEQNVQRSIKELRSTDILIAPELSGISFLDFAQYVESIKAGEKATHKMASQLAALQVSDEQYAAFEYQRSNGTLTAKAPSDKLPLAKVEIEGPRYINPKTLITQIGLKEGQLVSQEQIRQAATRLYGRGDIDNVETVITDTDGQRNVLIRPTESSSSRNRLRVGLEFSSDFADENRFALSLMHVASSLNSYGGELRTVARIGSQRQLGMQLWQPLAAGSPWFIEPSLEYNGRSLDLYNEGRKSARVGVRSTQATLAFGRQLDNWGAIEAGVSRGFGKIDLLLPSAPNQDSVRFFDTTQFVRFRIDTLDSLAYPTRGHLITSAWERAPSKGPGEPSQAQSEIDALTAFQFGDWAGHLYGEWGRSKRGSAPSPLGGFLRLSGTANNSLSGNATAFGRLLLARKIGALPSTVGGAIRLGFSAELGNTYDDTHPLRFNTLKQAASAHLSVDTRFGPLFFGAGATRGNGSSLYLFLGPIW
ncbi:patatin-like phospholipase family protein [Undibacterium sp. TS12]|uniref:patatin-like phospholipase family protein n=1 Tax=Undibacterium sp. TS12 TaxID=2908202 RepID=UPI001F4CE4E6|nr:patatin-like phospholipase family protein [Undibacterium sp. TS12]MCH8620082.1 patatin-like phospholipase family protein [Undibacterium sp. TS12]